MQSHRLMHPSCIRINARKPPAPLIVVSCPEIIEPCIGIKLLPGVEVVVGGGAAAAEEIAEGVVVVAVRDRTGGVDELAGGELAVVEVVGDSAAVPGDQVVAVKIGGGEGILLVFLQHLGVDPGRATGCP